MNGRDKNNLRMVGKINSCFKLHHESYGNKFYGNEIEIERLSGVKDTVPIVIPEKTLKLYENCAGKTVEIYGEFHSFNIYNPEENKKRLELFVYAKEFDVVEDASGINEIELIGTICRNPIYRKTPMGREITDILLAVNRSCKRSAYLPCIAWGKNARFASNLNIGTRICISGRVQSRKYTKVVGNECFDKIAYEVSISKIETVNINDNKNV